MKVWKDLIKACRVVLFTDSEAVRGAFLKSWSANDDSDKMISVKFQVQSDFDVPVWIERVLQSLAWKLTLTNHYLLGDYAA